MWLFYPNCKVTAQYKTEQLSVELKFLWKSPVQIFDWATVNWQKAAGDPSCTDSGTNTSFLLEDKKRTLFRQANWAP